jgi:hypothetical protein
VLGRSRWRRSVRWLGLDRNPLRRPVDRVEAGIRMGLVAAFLLIAPPISAGASGHVKTAGLRAEHDQAARHRAVATLLQDAPPLIGRFGMTATKALVDARWTTPSGSPRTGSIRVPWGRKAGSATTIWIDDTGRAADPPLRRSRLAGQEVMAVTLTLIVLAAGALMIGQVVVRPILDRLRMARWEADWSAVEPQWTGRRRQR